MGAGEILELAKETDGNNILDDLTSILGNNSKSQDLFSLGAKLLPILFDNKASDLTDTVSSQAGIKKTSVTSLLSFAAPFILSLLGKHVKTSGMGLSGLTSLLMGQKDAVLGALPSGLGNILNLAELGDFKDSTGPEKVTYTAPEEKKQGD